MTLAEHLGLRPRLSDDDVDRIMFYRGLRLDGFGVVMVNGDLGSGKSAWGAVTSWIRRQYFGYPVVSNVLLKPSFGEYSYIDTPRMVAEMRKINRVLKDVIEKFGSGHVLPDEAKTMMEELWEKSGTNLWRRTILLDEGYGSFEKRRGQSSKLLLNSYLIQQARHYESLVIVIASSSNLLDRYRLLDHITHQVSCTHIADLEMSLYRVHNRKMPFMEGVNPGVQRIFIPNWAGLWDSWVPVAVPDDLLESALRAEGLK